MRLDLAIVARALTDSRAKAAALITGGHVSVNGAVVTKVSFDTKESDDIIVTPPHDYVGRGALKLAHALDHFGVDVTDTVAIDLGASTGGFTEVLLRGGARRVYAIDVGQGQLHPKIAGDARVINIEKTHAKDVNASIVPDMADVLVADVSFISLTKALPAPLLRVKTGGHIIVLIKPQFEVGPAHVGRGGIVSDACARIEAVHTVRQFFETAGCTASDVIESPISGGDGNIEFLMMAVKR